MLLSEKISLTRSRLYDIHARFGSRACVAWTGGKDSTVVLFLWRQIVREQTPVAPVRAVNVDTGCKFAAVLTFRDQVTKAWDIDLHIISPGIDLNSYPLAADPLSCCQALKILPLTQAIAQFQIPALLTGVRTDEHRQREIDWLEKHPDHFRVAPILEWSELDIWTFLVRENIPWCPLYDQGYRSLGCRPCTTRSVHGERSGRDGRKEEQMGQLRSLGYF